MREIHKTYRNFFLFTNCFQNLWNSRNSRTLIVGKRWTMNIAPIYTNIYEMFIQFCVKLSHISSIRWNLEWATLACRQMFEINYFVNFSLPKIEEIISSWKFKKLVQDKRERCLHGIHGTFKLIIKRLNFYSEIARYVWIYFMKYESFPKNIFPIANFKLEN